MAGLKVPGTVFVARIIPFGIRIGKSVDHPMEKEEIEEDGEGGREGREIARAIPRISFFPRRDERENDFVHVHARTFFEITWIHLDLRLLDYSYATISATKCCARAYKISRDFIRVF